MSEVPVNFIATGQSEFEHTELSSRAAEKLQSLPLAEAAEAGFVRDRNKYFLNIAYPSMQAMDSATEDDVYPTDASQSDGRDVALYVHVPFCTAECYYCHYYKEFHKPEEKVDAFIDGVSEELSLRRQRLGPLRAESVYVGGGTPSYLNPRQIDKLFDVIGSTVSVATGAEISFEVHPESGDRDRFAALIANGVNRVNIGVESFNDNLLVAENRRHTAAEALEVIARAEASGFAHVNLDLIYGLKHQTVPLWEETLDVVRDIEPDSVTMYYLRLKQKTPEFVHYRRGMSPFPSEEDVLLMHAMNFERMEGDLGYSQNPVDWFIRNPDHFHTYQDHNWRKSDETELLGVGPSAYSYMNGWQHYNVNDTDRYLQSVAEGVIPVWRGEKLEGDERMRRTIMLGIKMGIDRQWFEQIYGADVVEAFHPEWRRLEELGLVEISSDNVALTYMGKLLADEVGQAFYSDSMRERMEAVDPTLVSTTWPSLNK